VKHAFTTFKEIIRNMVQTSRTSDSGFDFGSIGNIPHQTAQKGEIFTLLVKVNGTARPCMQSEPKWEYHGKTWYGIVETQIGC